MVHRNFLAAVALSLTLAPLACGGGKPKEKTPDEVAAEDKAKAPPPPKIASNIVFEILKEQEMMRQAVNALPTSISSSTIDNDNDPRQDCFDECLERLREKERTLILDYYQEEGHAKIENHKEMAARMGIPLNALRIRVHRIRVRLETDVKRTWSSLAQRET
jgi:DNA-directed RNA polymerase specialized sigma24 family protein